MSPLNYRLLICQLIVDDQSEAVLYQFEEGCTSGGLSRA